MDQKNKVQARQNNLASLRATAYEIPEISMAQAEYSRAKFEALAKANEGKIKVGKVNVDDEAMLSVKFGIVSIPTLMLFKDGQLVKTEVGYLNMPQLEAFAEV